VDRFGIGESRQGFSVRDLDFVVGLCFGGNIRLIALSNRSHASGSVSMSSSFGFLGGFAMTSDDSSSDDNSNEPMVLELGPFDLSRIKKPSSVFSAPLEFLIPAGRVVLGWSGVEQSMDQLIAHMLFVTRQTEPRWERRNFRNARRCSEI
jgi:hypothetical protein